MSTKLPVNRIANALEEWQKREERFLKIFSSDISLEKDGKERKLFIEANPQFKSINVYDENLKKTSMSSVLGNKTAETLEINNKNSVNQKVEQGRKKGLSI